ncbi:hypothetical protein CBS101457_004515 [Exobasidium rhododendri]|nr:hypothetical protein CBS101457_004515 [Exobasidium rhododendri]
MSIDAKDEASSSSALPTSTHLITIPFPSEHAPSQLIAHLTRFEGPSYLLWCGSCNDGWSPSSLDEQLQSQTSSSLLIEEHHPPRTVSTILSGQLSTEWAVSMSNARHKVSLHMSAKVPIEPYD